MNQYLCLSELLTINIHTLFTAGIGSLSFDKLKIATNIEFTVCQTFSCVTLSDKRVQVRLQQAAAAARTNVGASHPVNKNQDNV